MTTQRHPCQSRHLPDAACRILQHALAYTRQGRAVFPCDPDKAPWTPHGFKDATTDREQIKAWWIEHPDAMIGLPTGKTSGLLVIDLDLDTAKGLDGITAFDALRPADTAPIVTRSHRTPRGGRHLLFAWPGVRVKNNNTGKIAAGVDIKGDGGYIIMSPSMNADGKQYTVETDMAPQRLPSWIESLLQQAHLLTDANQDTASVTEQSEHTETTEAIKNTAPDAFSADSVVSADSVTSLEDVLSQTQPQRPGQRNRCLLDLARGLKFNLNMAGKPLAEIKPIVRQWHKDALPIIGTKDFDTTWADFLNAWARAKHGLGDDVLSSAWRKCQSTALPPEALAYDSVPVRNLVALCAALASQSPDGRFFSLNTRRRAREIQALVESTPGIARDRAKGFGAAYYIGPADDIKKLVE
jgi:putative DNA primase/helicase